MKHDDGMTEFRNFLRGIAETTNSTTIEADEQWAGYSRQLGTAERERIEAGGYDRGLQIGAEIKAQAQ